MSQIAKLRVDTSIRFFKRGENKVFAQVYENCDNFKEGEYMNVTSLTGDGPIKGFYKLVVPDSKIPSHIMELNMSGNQSEESDTHVLTKFFDAIPIPLS